MLNDGIGIDAFLSTDLSSSDDEDTDVSLSDDEDMRFMVLWSDSHSSYCVWWVGQGEWFGLVGGVN